MRAQVQEGDRSCWGDMNTCVDYKLTQEAESKAHQEPATTAACVSLVYPGNTNTFQLFKIC